ncbi:MAG: T9SS type A sorting domain-containing protein [Ignavibacteriales bacterium]|nr:T9SS type A sorting domain-containing protein [Ignavibacteriales bacterium]
MASVEIRPRCLVSAYSNVAFVEGEPVERHADEEIVIVIPKEVQVSQNFPNPFNPETQISFALPEPSFVSVTVLDVLGREIVRLVEREYSAGYQRLTWNATDAAGGKVGSGVYFYRIVATGQSGKQFTKVMKMALTK